MKIVFIKVALFLGLLSYVNASSFQKKADIKDDDLIDKFYLGKSFFRIPWVEAPSATTARDGLGPFFNANTCTSCHIKNAKGIALGENDYIGRGLIVKISVPQTSKKTKIEETEGFIPDSNYGGQIQINSVHGVPIEAIMKIKDTHKTFVYPDGKKVVLSKPNVIFEKLNYGKLPKNINISLRYSPALIGMGAIDKIKDEDILKYEDEFDTNQNGISGKANWVYSKKDLSIKLGKFNHKASMPSLIEQIALAANEDMGLTNAFYETKSCTKNQKECLNAPRGRDIDLPFERLDAIRTYLSYLQIPNIKVKQKQGEELFHQIGCISCHRPSYVVDEKRITPYSDFLLHDLGKEMGDGRSEFSASGDEWRTMPLWGISINKQILKDKVRFLHDGRARNVEEAILWHGGEAQEIKNKFVHLEKEKREKIIQFLEEL